MGQGVATDGVCRENWRDELAVTTAHRRTIGLWTVFRPLLIGSALAAYIAVLEYSYRVVVAPRFGYLGYIYRQPEFFWVLAGFVLILAVALLLPKRLSRASDVMGWILFVVVLVPIAEVPYFGSFLAPAEVFTYSLFAAVVVILIGRIPSTEALRRIVPLASRRSSTFWTVLIMCTVLTYGSSFAVFGFQLDIMSVFDVASTRLEYRDEVAPNVPVLGYLVSNQGNVINPLLICIGVARRDLKLVAIGAFGQLLLYSVTGYRTSLLSIPICIIASLILRRRETLGGEFALIGTVVLAWCSVVVDRLFALGTVDLIVNRMLITAGHLTPYYLQVYAGEAWHYWAYSFLGWFVDDPYSVSPGFNVSVIAFGRPDIQSNANLFADGYANLGYVGVMFEAGFLLMVLLLVNSASRNLPMRIVLPTLIIPSFALANGSPFTAFLSFGLALATLLFALMPRDAPLALKSSRRETGSVVRGQTTAGTSKLDTIAQT